MLSKREREYLADIERFEDEHFLYAKVVRNRIRRKAATAIDDLILIVSKDGHGRTPHREFLKRQDKKLLEKLRNKEIEGDELKAEMAVANVRKMFYNDYPRRREERMIWPYKWRRLLQTIGTKDKWIRDDLKSILAEITFDETE